MNKRLLVSFSLILCGSLVPLRSNAAELCKDVSQVTVQGRGKVAAVPDRARIWVEVSEQGPQLDDVTQAVRQKIAAVIKTIKDHGISDKDIQTQSYRVSPQSVWSGRERKRTGFEVSNRVEVLIRDLKKVGTVISAALDAGANGINGPVYDFEDSQALERQALQLAVRDAKAKAELLAKESGASIGRTLTISEGGVAFPMPRPLMLRASAMDASRAASAPEPIEAGEENVTANVTVTFELK